MALDRNTPWANVTWLPTSKLIDLSLRNHLCLAVLRSEHGKAVHMGMIVKTMFSSFFIFDAGFGKGDVSIFLAADESLSQREMPKLDSPWSLRSSAMGPTARLLALYDEQLQTTPLRDLMEGHQRAIENFAAPPQWRLSIPALVQRYRKRKRVG
ncbi:hypothetical protein [Paraburkholderia sp. HD33-4]|uniref:hypothetical protein n=1 Tax=Paraburkholderia sp. HD33-4 TaxID=2883242 RepID=UPI001F44E46F|nr:hypothetical protein [Paraburkholderia sp. HD33-4]